MDRKHDLDTDEICSEKVSDGSIITPKIIRAEFVGVIVTLEDIRRVGSNTLESCRGRQMSKNSVLVYRERGGLV